MRKLTHSVVKKRVLFFKIKNAGSFNVPNFGMINTLFFSCSIQKWPFGMHFDIEMIYMHVLRTCGTHSLVH